MKTGIAISEQEYLTNPDYAHSEYAGGEVIDKPMGNKDHNRLQGRFFSQLEIFAEKHGLYVGTELHSRLTVGREIIFRVPDVGIAEEDQFDDKKYHIGGPLLVVEIRSPEDRTKAILKKAEEYFANGTKLVWIVDPESRNVMVLVSDRIPWIVEVGEELTGAPIWPDLRVDLEAAFKGI